MRLTPHSELRRWLVLALGDLEGSASRQVVLATIASRFGNLFTDDDRESPKSRPDEPKWANRVSWERADMVEEGLLAPYLGPGTPWSLTDEGWEILERLRGQEDADAGAAVPFAHFKPKDDSDYQARVKAARVTKKRSHETLIAGFGEWCIARGCSASTAEHPIDLVLRRDGVEWLVEAKVVYDGDATLAVRAALAQVLMYAHFLRGKPAPILLALFSESIGDAYVEFLETYDVASIWSAGDGWDGSRSAGALLARAPTSR